MEFQNINWDEKNKSDKHEYIRNFKSCFLSWKFDLFFKVFSVDMLRFFLRLKYPPATCTYHQQHISVYYWGCFQNHISATAGKGFWAKNGETAATELPFD